MDAILILVVTLQRLLRVATTIIIYIALDRKMKSETSYIWYIT
jgi:hypothetical protein